MPHPGFVDHQSGGSPGPQTGGTCSALSYFLTDQLGSVAAVTDAGGALGEPAALPALRPGAHGCRLDHTDGFRVHRSAQPGRPQGSSFQFGLMDYHARFYDPSLGRFTQPDTFTPGGPQGLNRYSYISNNPVKIIDPTGHMQSGECGYQGEDCPVSNSVTPLEAQQDLAKAAYFSQRTEALKCHGGDKLYCSEAQNHPAAVVAYAITGLVSAAALPEAWAITEAFGWNVATVCATSIICWTITGAGGVGAAGVVGNQVGSNQIGRNGVNQVLKTLNDPNALTEQTVTGNGLSGRIDILTNTAMNEVKNVANLSLSQQFMEQAYKYSEIAQANELELHYWLVNDHPQYIVDWLSRLGIIVH